MALDWVILVVDDHPTVHLAVGRALELHGFGVLHAWDGVEAVQIYEQFKSRISLVLLDLEMPRMRGEEALPQILELDPDASVIISSSDPEHVVAGSLGELRHGFLPKPYATSELLEVILAVLGKEEAA